MAVGIGYWKRRQDRTRGLEVHSLCGAELLLIALVAALEVEAWGDKVEAGISYAQPSPDARRHSREQRWMWAGCCRTPETWSR